MQDHQKRSTDPESPNRREHAGNEPQSNSDNARPASTGRQEDEQRESDYGNFNSGRRAAGHGGGSLDRLDEFEGENRKAGHVFSGAGQGHTPQRSFEKESREELESRSGPYTRDGRPAARDSTSNGGA